MELKIFILCAGYGKRVRPVTGGKQKCAETVRVDYEELPMFMHQMRVISKAMDDIARIIGGIEYGFYLVVGYRADDIIDAIAEYGSEVGRIHGVLYQHAIDGIGGAWNRIRAFLDGEMVDDEDMVVIVNCDDHIGVDDAYRFLLRTILFWSDTSVGAVLAAKNIVDECSDDGDCRIVYDVERYVNKTILVTRRGWNVAVDIIPRLASADELPDIDRYDLYLGVGWYAVRKRYVNAVRCCAEFEPDVQAIVSSRLVLLSRVNKWIDMGNPEILAKYRA